jgi:transcription-repair coupling factor (superfamily II helicase)
VSINLGVDVSIPKEYIIEASQRLRSYKRIASAETEETLVKIRSEIEDRYGRIPGSVENLFLYGRLRKLAERAGIVSIDKAGSDIAFKFAESTKVGPERLMEILSSNERASFSPSGILRIAAGDENPLQTAIRLIESMA